MLDMGKYNFTDKEKIIHQLFLRSYSIKSPGLFYGKMGVAISLFDYAKYTGNTLFLDMGEELIDGILDDVGYKTGFDFASGLSGIAWGIEYIVQQGYISCDTSLVCSDIDRHMEKISIHRLHDLSLETGLEGILHYVLIRLKGASRQNRPVPFSSDFLDDIFVSIRSKKESEMPDSLCNLANQFVDYQQREKLILYQLNIQSFIKEKAFSGEIGSAMLGLKNGLAGWLYSLK